MPQLRAFINFVRSGVVAYGVAAGAMTSFALAPISALALPFNQDMVGTQLANGTIQREGAKDSVAVGTSQRYIGDKREDALVLSNPVTRTVQSVSNGSRLYRAQCAPCHGSVIDGAYVQGPVAKFVPGPHLFIEAMKAKPDAHYFQYIYFGGLAIMPRYGYKLSIDEQWDIVNYIRDVQDNFKSP